MAFFEQLQAINNREDFTQFLPTLLHEFEKNKDEYANGNIPSFLLAIQHIVEELTLNEEPNIQWQEMASILHVALMSPVDQEEL